MFGWVCPRCQLVHSPYVDECLCSPPTVTSTGIGDAGVCTCSGQPNTAGICLLCGHPKYIQGYTFYV